MVRSRLWLLVAVWSVPPILMMVQAWLNGGVSDVGRALAREGVPWMIWIPLTPMVLRRAALPGTLRGRRLAGHVGTAFAAAVRELHHGAGELVVILHSGARLPVSRRRREALERLLGSPG